MAATFTSRDLAYNGPDRRNHHRRQHEDRRQSIRFEPGNYDRRQHPGRRKDDLSGWNRSQV